MLKIFISYRRADSRYASGWLRERLVWYFGRRNVFFDTESLTGGVKFAERIREQIRECDVVLVVIGRDWLVARSHDNPSQRRFDDPRDHVRTEIAIAMKEKKLIVPILLDGAVRPRESDGLPQDIADLVRLNDMHITAQFFHRDVHRLVEQLTRDDTDWNRLFPMLRHAFVGTLLAMLLVRPLFAELHWAQLSNWWGIGLFHGVFGSLLWGTLIPLFVLFAWSLGSRRLGPGASTSTLVRSVAAGVIGGLLGGILASVGCILIHHQDLLLPMGWVHSSWTGLADLFRQTMETRMAYAFPIAGVFTGIGLGLFCHFTLTRIQSEGETGASSLPFKRRTLSRGDFADAAAMVFRHRAHLFLLIPIAGALLSYAWFKPSNGPSIFATTVGEGLIHYLGCVGLCIGMFIGLGARGRE